MPDKQNSFASMPPVDGFEGQRLLAELESAMFGTGAPVQLGRYVVGERLGAGGMGVVYEAEDPRLRRKVALKILHPDQRAAHASVGHQRLRREARSISQVSHPNVVEIFDVGEADGRVYIAMELIDGASLDSWLSQARRSWSEIVEVFVQAGRGLVAAHAAGLVHRDFKPSNVSISSEGRVRVLDFGLAKAHAGDLSAPNSTASIDARRVSTREGGIVGTPRYMAPEQLQGDPGTARSDQYAFCVSLFEALFGRPPFRESKMVASKLAEDRMSAPARHGVPRRIVRALQRGLRADPTRRWATMDALLARLETGARVRPAVIGAAAALVAASLAMSWDERPSVDGDPSERTEHARADWDDALVNARALRLHGDHDGAAEASRRVLDEARRAKDRRTAARAARSLGQSLLDMGQLDDGLEVLEEGHTDAVVVRADDTRAALAAIIGRVVVRRTGVTAAERWQRDARAIAADHELSDDTRLAILAMECQIAYYAGNAEAALEFADRAVELARRTQHPKFIETVYNRSVTLFRNMRLDEARASTLELLEYTEALGDDGVRTADALNLLGPIEATIARQSDPERLGDAIAHSRRAVEIYRTIADLPAAQVSRAELNLGHTLSYAGEYAESNAYYERSLQRLRTDSAAHTELVAELETGIGQNLVKLGELDGAQTHLHRALLAMEEVLGLEHPRLFGLLQSLAVAQRERGALEKAMATLERALALPGVSTVERAGGLWDAADVAHLDGRDADAAAFVERAVAAYERSDAPGGAREVRAWAAENLSN